MLYDRLRSDVSTVMPYINKLKAVQDTAYYCISQSFLNDFLLCPERARGKLHLDLPSDSSDSTLLGSAVHAAIEEVLRGGTVDDAIQLGVVLLETEWEDVEKTKIKRIDTARKMYRRLFSAWHEEIFPQLGEVEGIEVPFVGRLIDEPGLIVDLSGTIDAIIDGRCWDWKTSARPWEPWEARRWNLQATAYTWALSNVPELKALRENSAFVPSNKFNFGVMIKSGKQSTQVVEVERDEDHWKFLIDLVRSVVAIDSVNLDRWPMSNTNALCSPLYCSMSEHGLCSGSGVR